MFSVNQRAVSIIKNEVLPNLEELNCRLHILPNGATVIDMGVHAPGSYLAAKLFVESTIGGLGYVTFGSFAREGLELPSIDVYVDHPQEACLSSQFSGWRIPQDNPPSDINPIGSGPARAIARNDIFSQAWSYQDCHHETLFAAQIQELPDEELAESVAEACGVLPENVYIIAAKTGSLVGSIQVCSRTVEASIWRLERKGFDISKIVSGSGTCPLPPPISDEFEGMDRVNTALLYGVTVRYIVDCRDEEIEEVLDKAPFSASKRFGERFADIFEEGKRDFYHVDKDIHTVARYIFHNYATGSSYSSGEIRVDKLRESFNM